MRLLKPILFPPNLISLWKKIIETSGAKIYALGIGMLTLVLLARLLGPEGRGVIAAVNSWVTLFVTFGALSLGTIAQYRAAQSKDGTWFPKTFGALALLALLLSGIGLLIAGGSYYLTNGRAFGNLELIVLCIGFSSLPLRIWGNYSTNLLMAVNQLRIVNKFQVISATLYLGAVYVFVGGFSFGVIGAMCCTLFSQAVIFCGAFKTLWKLTKRKLTVDLREVKDLLKGGAQLHLNAIGAVLFSQSDILVLNHYSSKAEVGLYQFSYQLVMILLIVPQTTSMVLYSRMATLNPDKMWPEQKQIGLQVLFLLLLCLIAAYFIAPIIIPLVAGDRFIPSVEVFQWLLPATFGMTFSIIMANQWIGRGFFLQASFLTLAAGFANLGLNIWLIPQYGMMGAIYATLIANIGISVTSNFCMAIYCEGRSREVMAT